MMSSPGEGSSYSREPAPSRAAVRFMVSRLGARGREPMARTVRSSLSYLLTPVRGRGGVMHTIPLVLISFVALSLSTMPRRRVARWIRGGPYVDGPAWQEKMQRAAQASLAVMCPACWCGVDGRWPYALRASGPNRKHAFEDAMTQAGSSSSMRSIASRLPSPRTHFPLKWAASRPRSQSR